MNKPNLIYILADDMGYGDVSALNEKCAFKTPAFDSIFENGIAFTDAHASSAVCSPSRYSILTGRYPWRSRMKTGVLGGYSKALIRPERLTVGKMLQKEGYKTAAIGKWHLGMDFAGDFTEQPRYSQCPDVDFGSKIENAPVTRGFDYYYGISASLDMPPYVYIENDRFTAVPERSIEGEKGKRLYRSGPIADDFVLEDVLPCLTKKALDVIDNWAGEPFFLYFPLPAPHTPILPSPEFQGKSNTNEYGDFVLMCDDVVAQIIQKMKDRGIYDNTILVYTSDNGCSPLADFKELADAGHNPSYHFRGHKADIYEGGHRIPLLLQWPAMIQKGKRCSQTVCLSDLMATMADLLGIHLPEDAAEDSVSNLPLWKNPEHCPVIRQDTVHESINGSVSIRSGKWKLEMCPGSGGWSWPKPGEEAPDSPGFQLYDLENDVGEKINVINEYPDIVPPMRKRLAEIIRTGRSTPGAAQPNEGEAVWDTIRWLNEQ
ncbi:MAG: arylsulfatase [Treponema sp.]|nr:arylsulfatase [Treponema sp.]